MSVPTRLDPDSFEIALLTDADDLSGFDSGDADLNGFLRDDAWRLQSQYVSRVYLARYQGQLIGYVALLADVVELKVNEKKKLKLAHDDPRFIPAVKVGRLAVAQEFRERLKGAGTGLLRYAAFAAIDTAESIGCRLLTLDAYQASVGFYIKKGFVENKAKKSAEETSQAGLPEQPSPVEARISTVSMRLDLRADPAPRLLSETWP